VFVFACGSPTKSMTTDGSGSNGGDGSGSNGGDGRNIDAPVSSNTRTVFVIPMENQPSSAIYGNTTDAPYINGLLPMAAHTTMFQDELPADPSEPHYVYMEGGTATFADITFTTDNDPSTSNSTASTAHLVNTLDAAGVTWMIYQEDITAGSCPIHSSGFYAVKHDPVMFYQDVIGNPPSTSTARCKAHHKPYSSFAADLATGHMPNYVFITPNLCDDMHGATGCPKSGTAGDIQMGDTWLQNELPRILTYAQAHDGVVLITWDEGDSSNLMAFLALGPRVKTNYTGSVVYNHGSVIKSVQEIFGVTPLAKVANDNDLADLFKAGMFP
jgi:hypothetical protein